jgi:hypothetical protein
MYVLRLPYPCEYPWLEEGMTSTTNAGNERAILTGVNQHP